MESELGWVPKGWSITPVGKLFKVIGGSTPSTKEEKYWKDGIFYWATPKDLSGLTAPILLSTERKITQAGLSQISSGLLPPGTVLMSSRAPIGYLAISAIPLAINQGIIAIICNELISNYYMLNWCYWNMENIKQHASGTTFEEINKVVFRSIPIIIPHQSLVRYYTNIVKPFYQKIQQNLEQSYTLTTIRDTLLPRLISGKLRVKDAEKLGGKEV
ncbi:MAG: restriction endonuclease subunit S [Firmicutes bacterium]|nr:restriction endonuclease subunit S [Bacillota bacterium]